MPTSLSHLMVIKGEHCSCQTTRLLKPQESDSIDALMPWERNFLEIIPRHHLCNARRFFLSFDFYGYFPYNLKALVVDLVDAH